MTLSYINAYAGIVLSAYYIETQNKSKELTMITFTLTVESSREKGARRGHQGQRVSAACWHAHGDFFDALFSINPDAVIVSMGTQTITKQDGNWQDRNIGSQMQPLYYSEACDCHEWK